MAKQKRQRKADPDLLARLWNDLALAWRLLFDRRVGGFSKLIPLAIVAYILSPLDIVPDVLLPFGVVDDISALVLGLQLFIRSAPPGVVEEYRNGLGKRKRGESPDVIEGRYEVRED